MHSKFETLNHMKELSTWCVPLPVFRRLDGDHRLLLELLCCKQHKLSQWWACGSWKTALWRGSFLNLTWQRTAWWWKLKLLVRWECFSSKFGFIISIVNRIILILNWYFISHALKIWDFELWTLWKCLVLDACPCQSSGILMDHRLLEVLLANYTSSVDCAWVACKAALRRGSFMFFLGLDKGQHGGGNANFLCGESVSKESKARHIGISLSIESYWTDTSYQMQSKFETLNPMKELSTWCVPLPVFRRLDGSPAPPRGAALLATQAQLTPLEWLVKQHFEEVLSCSFLDLTKDSMVVETQTSCAVRVFLRKVKLGISAYHYQ